MKIQLESRGQANIIRAYAPGSVTINQQVYRTSVLITPDRVTEWPPHAFGELTEVHFDAVCALGPELVVLGTGSQLRFPAPALLQGLVRAGIGFEVMDTAAACRTYNVLVNEGRRVAAALLMIPAANSGR